MDKIYWTLLWCWVYGAFLADNVWSVIEENIPPIFVGIVMIIIALQFVQIRRLKRQLPKRNKTGKFVKRA